MSNNFSGNQLALPINQLVIFVCDMMENTDLGNLVKVKK